MKLVIAAFLMALSLPALAKADRIACSIGNNYAFSVDLKTNQLNLWKMIPGGKAPILKDTVVKQEEGFGTLKLRLKNLGVISLDFANELRIGEGDWIHNGALDTSLPEGADANYNGKAFVSECDYQ